MDSVETRKLRVIFSNVIKGYTPVVSSNYGSFFIKHFNIYDLADADEVYNKFYQQAVNDGVPTQNEREEFLIKQDIISHKDEEKIVDLKKTINNLYDNYNREYLKSKRIKWKTEIDKLEEELQQLEFIRANLVGKTAEIFASKKSNEFYIQQSLYTDSSLTNLLFRNEDFEEMDEQELAEVVILYNQKMQDYGAENFKKIAISPFFCNLFYLSGDNPQTFYGKPIIHLTIFQSDIFSYGRYFKHIMSEFKDKIPKEVMENPTELMDWVEMNQNVQKVLGDDKEKSALGIVGATKEDLEILGLKPNQSFSLSEELKKRGGRISMEELMKLHGE